MDTGSVGEIVWHKQGDKVLVNFIPPSSGRRGRALNLQFGSMSVTPVRSKSGLHVVYAQPLRMNLLDGAWKSNPIFAILGGVGQGQFSGSRANFRDIIHAAQREGQFIYVVAPNDVTSQPIWNGYIRIGFQRWVRIPCPRPSAVYNRVPTRNAERHPSVVAAKHKFKSLGIPLFNPEYFNKRVIYSVLERSAAEEYLPESVTLDGAPSLYRMLQKHPVVYLKPTGGSIGHGILRLDTVSANAYRLSVLKNSRCSRYQAQSFTELWKLVKKHRLQAEYTIQAGKNLIEYQGRPCDFRVLVQKENKDWQLTGVGVRVSGPDTITTHVPNGGFIAPVQTVLAHAFGSDASNQYAYLQSMVLSCAKAIDGHYMGQLGEMSMDVGMDSAGRCWFFEANAKPMKFDEPEIREKSIQGVLQQLAYLAKRER